MRKLYQYVRQRGGLQYVSFAHDLIVAVIAFVAAFAVAYNTNYLFWIPNFSQKVAAFVAISAVCIYVFRINRTSWRYVSIPDLLEIIKAVVVAVAIEVQRATVPTSSLVENIEGAFREGGCRNSAVERGFRRGVRAR